MEEPAGRSHQDGKQPKNKKETSHPLEKSIPPIPSAPSTERRKPTISERLRRPHILAEMLQCSSRLSADAQADYLSVLEQLVGELRLQLEGAGLVGRIEIDHTRLWVQVCGKKVAFLDGGVASMAAIGAAPVAIRIGSYVVRPGDYTQNRERFNHEIQLVDELYESTRSDAGLFEDLFEDLDKLREVARIALEAGGALTLVQRESPDLLFMQGALVNPVSEYALAGFPNFSRRALELLLPEGERDRTGADANFVRVHLRQLELLKACGTVVCGVVERKSPSQIVAHALLEELANREVLASRDRDIMWRRLHEYRISDAILFECLLEEGEYLTPISIDRNELGRAPDRWKPDIRRYPRPRISYVKPSAMSLPVRVELFDEGTGFHSEVFDLLIHSSRLLPKYSFPAGLDIVDKFAKIPVWMSKPVNTHLAVQLMRKALDTKNPVLINEMRRMLCGTGRDWLFRPTFDRM